MPASKGDTVEHEEYGKGVVTGIITDSYGRTFAYWVDYEDVEGEIFQSTVNSTTSLK